MFRTHLCVLGEARRSILILQRNDIIGMRKVEGLGFPGDSGGEESACNPRDLGSIPGLGRCPGEGKGYLLQYSGLENSLDYIVHGVVKS